MFSKDHLAWVRTVYIYLATFLGLIFIMIGSATLVNRFLQTYVFPVDYYYFNGMYECKTKYDPGAEKERDMTEEEQTECKTQMEEQNKKNAENEKNRDFAWSLSMLLVGIPVFIGHWRIVRKEK